MSLTAIIAAITGVSAIVGGIVYLFKLGIFAFSKSPEQQKQDVDNKVNAAIGSAEQGGRPTDV